MDFEICAHAQIVHKGEVGEKQPKRKRKKTGKDFFFKKILGGNLTTFKITILHNKVVWYG